MTGVQTCALPISIFSGKKILLELWDHDKFDPDDFLGKFEFDCAMKGKGIQKAHFNAGSAYITLNGDIKEGAYYIIEFEVE